MKRNSGSISITIGASILILMSLGLAGTVYSLYLGDDDAQQESDSSTATEKNDPLARLKKEKNINITPVPEDTGSGTRTLNTETGIPTGTYSNPPTTVNSFGGSETGVERPIDNYGSSVERNRLNQERFSSTTPDYSSPDYSSPASSNNFNNTSDNSLIEPLENDDFLDTNTSTDSSEEESLTPPALTERSF